MATPITARDDFFAAHDKASEPYADVAAQLDLVERWCRLELVRFELEGLFCPSALPGQK